MNKLIIQYNNNIIIDKNSVQELLPVQAANKPMVNYDGAEKNQFALIMYDPDAPSGTHIHWVVVNISGSSIGWNLDRRGTTVCDYKGPSPPPGKPHRYIFLLYQQTQQTEGGEIPKDVIEFLKTKLNQSRIMNIGELLSQLHLSNLAASVTFMSQTKRGRKGIKGRRVTKGRKVTKRRKSTKRRWRHRQQSKRRT
jgi:hypothetical protein